MTYENDSAEQYERNIRFYGGENSARRYLAEDMAERPSPDDTSKYTYWFSSVLLGATQIINGLGQYHARHWWRDHRAKMKAELQSAIKILQDLVDTM